MPKIYTYIEKSDNRDIQEYRGYADWIARYGRDDAAILTAMYRLGTKGYTQGQIDLSYPISDKIFGRTGTFLHFQLLGGYGETLIDYNKKSETQLRVGISLAR
jgi:outer membrane phospholipase A